MRKHKALGLAEQLRKLHSYQFATWCVEEPVSADAALIESMHALIVQMREAIKLHQERDFNSDHTALDRAAKDADQYLGEQA